MKGDLLSADGLEAASIIALASIIGVHRNRIAEWRAKGAPEGLQLHAWAGWFQRHGRAVLASRVRSAFLDSAQPSEQTSSAGQPLGTPAAAEDQPPIDDDPAAQWRLREARAKALRAELALEQERIEASVAKRDLIPSAECRTLLARFAASVNDVIGRGIWNELLQAIPGAPVDIINRLRRAHIDAVLVQRSRIATAAHDVAASLRTKETTKEPA